MGSTPTTGTDIKPQKAQSFLGLFFCGVDTGVEQSGAAKPRIIPVRSYNCARGRLSPLPCCDAGFRHSVSGAYAGGGVLRCYPARLSASSCGEPKCLRWAFPLSETISGEFGLVLYLRQIHRWPDV